MEKLIRSNTKGKVTYNMLTEEYKIEFGNVYITLDFYQFKEFEEVVETIQINQIENKKDNRIRIPFESDNLSIVLNSREVLELKDLLGFNQGFQNIKLNVSFSVN